jgi:hypothetical protein
VRPRNETGASDVAVMIQKFEPRSSPVRAQEHYRQRALECYLIAEGIVDPGKRLAMLELARNWVALGHHADQGETRAAPWLAGSPDDRRAA